MASAIFDSFLDAYRAKRGMDNQELAIKQDAARWRAQFDLQRELANKAEGIQREQLGLQRDELVGRERMFGQNLTAQRAMHGEQMATARYGYDSEVKKAGIYAAPQMKYADNQSRLVGIQEQQWGLKKPLAEAEMNDLLQNRKDTKEIQQAIVEGRDPEKILNMMAGTTLPLQSLQAFAPWLQAPISRRINDVSEPGYKESYGFFGIPVAEGTYKDGSSERNWNRWLYGYPDRSEQVEMNPEARRLYGLLGIIGRLTNPKQEPLANDDFNTIMSFGGGQ